MARWGDKTPWRAWHLREISRLFPDAVFLAMVRQPGAVATSVSDRFQLSFICGIRHCANTTKEQVQRAAELGDRLLLVRYEDLVTDPETTLREIFAWLEEPWSQRLLEHHRVHSERGTPQRVEGMTRSDQPIDSGRIAAWADTRTDVELAELRRRVGRLGDFYGYDLSDPRALHAIAGRGSLRKRTLTGP
jgi:Sulfotransferase domain.